MNKCQECGSEKITYYRQMRADHVWVVTARCENWHHPIKGKPFYPIANFVLKDLPTLPKETPYIPRQLTMLEQIEKEAEEQYPKKYPPMPRPKFSGRNFPVEIK